MSFIQSAPCSYHIWTWTYDTNNAVSYLLFTEPKLLNTTTERVFLTGSHASNQEYAANDRTWLRPAPHLAHTRCQHHDKEEEENWRRNIWTLMSQPFRQPAPGCPDHAIFLQHSSCRGHIDRFGETPMTVDRLLFAKKALTLHQ